MDRRRERLLSAYLDGELNPEQLRLVETWLRQEPEAQKCYRELAAVRALLQRLPVREAPQDLEERVLQTTQARGAGLTPWTRWRAVLAGALAAAAAGVVLLPLVRGEVDRLRAAQSGVHWFAWEHASRSAADLGADRTALQIILVDAALGLLGERASGLEEER